MKRYFCIFLSAIILFNITSCLDNTSESASVKPPYPTYTEKDGTVYICAFLREITEDSVTADVAEYITPDNPERIEELQLTEDDMIGGYNIYNPDTETVVWKLDDQTVYHFVDWGHDFTGTESVEEYTTKNVFEFIEYIGTYENSKPGMPFFFQGEDGVVKVILEKWIA